MSRDFDPANAACWLSRGRSMEYATAIAEAWRRYPDLPIDAPPDARIARLRDRAEAMRPLHEAMRVETEQRRQRDNFAFVERQLAAGVTDPRHAPILHARDIRGHDWDAAVAFAAGWHAAQAGWDARSDLYAGGVNATNRRQAYDQGFREGGGHPDDIFDAARRRLTIDPGTRTPMAGVGAGLKPSQWPTPTDRPHPVSWHRRLLIIGASEAKSGAVGILPMLRLCSGHGATTILIAHADGTLGFADDATPPDESHTDFRARVAATDYGDILVAAEGPELATVDAHAQILPLCRTMERTRNSLLQQRAQFRLWIARGRAVGEQFAGGHIRWGKVAAGLTGRLGEFTARYGGPAQPRGHRILITDTTGELADGYFAFGGAPLAPERIIGNKGHLRQAMAEQLRQFAAAIRMG
jgi:hypothetical protein